MKGKEERRESREDKRENRFVQENRFGQMGAPLSRTHPFMFGFLAALGVFAAYALTRALSGASQAIVLIFVAMFLAVGLSPAVEALQGRGLKRGPAVLVIVIGFLALVGGFSVTVVPPLVNQTTQLVQHAPNYLDQLTKNPTIAKLDKDFGVVTKTKLALESKMHDGKLVISAFGGVVGVGKTILSGLFAVITVIILTIYFLASLPKITHTAYSLIPASRRARVSSLTDEILLRIGSFVGGQLIVASIAGVATLIMTAIVGIPYPVALAMVVATCDLIPLIGASLGAIIVTIVALTHGLALGIISILFFIIFQQLENYVVYPRVMKRSVSVPGAVTIVAALIGGSLLGLLGGLLAIPTAAAILLILDQVAVPNAERG
ncbi:MAG TPA: AI-2E family transporter [Candidatus Nanopelagicaceae bacterium]|nr:AI-2E family transporter [Candidatus Nanopelagicaceae bacterium]